MNRIRVTERVAHRRVAHGRAGYQLSRLSRLVGLVPLVFGLVCTGGRAARADNSVTVDYGAVAAFSQTTPYSTSGLTATPAAGETLTGGNGIGLGVPGGTRIFFGDDIDGSESVRFTFTAGPATGVTFQGANGVGGGAMNLEGFAADGHSLGTVTFSGFDAVTRGIDVSGAFGGVPLSGFAISGNGSTNAAMQLWKVTFTPPDTVPPSITASASKSVLWPPNGNLVPVKVTGTIVDNTGGSGVDLNTVDFTVVDEYGQVQPAASVTLAVDGSYSFTVYLPASRLDTDLNGRTFTICVSAKDIAGNAASKSVVVTVPHDMAGR
jgi:hypothetical protein